jgi:prepilin-type N-terminal cleavage/methylation domain-containing protein
MTLRIGNSAFTPLDSERRYPQKHLILGRHVKGFTLIEVMVASAILAFGTVFIYEALFKCLDAYNYYECYLNVLPWMDEKIWQVQDELSNSGNFSEETSGEFVNKNRKFLWDLSIAGSGQESGLFKIDLKTSWQSGRKRLSLSRSAYALLDQE